MSTNNSTNNDNNNSIPRHIVRLMREEDVEQCWAIFAAHDMPEQKCGLSTYRSIEPNGHYVVVNDEDGSIISFAGCHTLDPRLAIVGVYGTTPKYQGKGLGIKSWNKMMEFLGTERNVGLSSSPAQAPIYKDKAGFIHEGPDQMVPSDSTGFDVKVIKPTDEESSNVKIVSLTDDRWEHVIKYDNLIAGYDRSKFLKISLREPNTNVVVAVVPSDPTKVLGYAAMKPTNYDDLPMLAPLYADSISIAKVLFYELATRHPIAYQKGYRAFTVTSNLEAKKLFDPTKLEGHYQCPRLFTKQVITSDQTHKVYAIISPCFGLY